MGHKRFTFIFLEEKNLSFITFPQSEAMREVIRILLAALGD
jgi:hypothetical protein